MCLSLAGVLLDLKCKHIISLPHQFYITLPQKLITVVKCCLGHNQARSGMPGHTQPDGQEVESLGVSIEHVNGINILKNNMRGSIWLKLKWGLNAHCGPIISSGNKKSFSKLSTQWSTNWSWRLFAWKVNKFLLEHTHLHYTELTGGNLSDNICSTLPNFQVLVFTS